MILLDIIIVNWNSGIQLNNCLNSLVITDTSDFRLNLVTVVDNHSSDHSLDNMENINIPLRVIRNHQNCGFAAACNQGAKGSDADYLLFLNPDTRLGLDSLQKPIQWMNSPTHKQVGIIGIQLIDETGKVSRSCARFPTLILFLNHILGLDCLFPRFCLSYPMLEWDHMSNKYVDQVMGAFFLVRRELFERLNGFDERFFLYYEEVDFSLRSFNMGYYSYYLSEARAFHKGGGSSEQVKDRRLFYLLRSRILYGYKHFRPYQAVLLSWATLFEFLIRLARAVFQVSWKNIKEIVSAYHLLWADLPSILRKAWNDRE